jgi:hypothetical protein
MTAPPISRDAISEALRRIAIRLAEARRVLGEDRLVTLSGLEESTRAICEAARALPPEDGRALRPDLEAMLYDLDSLATDLTARFGPQARHGGDAAGGRDQPTLATAYRDGIRRAGGTADEKA